MNDRVTLVLDTFENPAAPHRRAVGGRVMGHRQCSLLFLVVCAVAPFVSGCASLTSVPLYSAARDQQGKDAAKAWSEVDLAGQLSAPRKNIKALLDEQLAMADASWSAHHASRAREMAYSWTLENYQEQLSVRYQTLAGASTREEIEKNSEALEKAEDNLQVLAQNFALVGQPPPNCQAILSKEGEAAALQAAAKLPEAPRVTVTQGLPRAAEDCRTIANVGSAGGQRGVAAARLKAEQAALAADEIRANELKTAYAAALAKYTESARTLLGDPNDPKAKDAVDKAVKQLADLVEKITKAQDAFSTKFITEERLESVDGFFKTYQDIAAGKEVKDGNKVAIALAVFPDLRDKARKALSDAQKPNLVPLALQKNIELAKLEAANKDIALRRQTVAERQAQVAALDAQIEAVAYARDPFDKDAGVKARLKESLLKVMSEKDDAGFDMRTKLWRGTTRYLEAEGPLRAETVKAGYRISALSHERALTYAESSINQWKALIDPSVELMAAYGASGLKSADLIALFNSLTLLWIGAGVH